MRRIALAVVLGSCCMLAASTARAEVGYIAYEPAGWACCQQPVVATAYYEPAPAVFYSSPAVAWTRYRPILGGVVTHMRFVSYPTTPAAYAPFWW
jgi:hypothetical protein